ncbi:Multidrug Resistance Protein family, partial [Monoraphidium neglectum]
MTLRIGAVAEQSFNAVERLHEYSTLESEAAAVIPGSAPEGWPKEGQVEFANVKMRYRPGLPLVGVVGRTGAGKSSVIGALFRLTEVEGGSILLDAIDTTRVPVLFAASVRVNLSPFGEHSDAELWSALRRAHLAPLVESLGGGLDHALAEGGAPLSAGQKQLLALARAVLSPAKVLVLDEATANVDVETDALIQTTMATEFSDRTIIAVAHRLHTIIASDRVLVLDQGVAVEYDTPKALLERPDGAFASMVHETGAATEAFLRAAAAGDQIAIGELDAAA